MKKPTKIILSLTFILFLSFLLVLKINKTTHSNEKLLIITTNFPAYDFARAVTGDKADIKMLMKPGVETHHFEPTPEDIIDIKNSDLFIYTGGESDQWVKDLLANHSINPANTLRMMDVVNLLEESHSDDHRTYHKETVYDEHVWTSLKNATIIVNEISAKLSQVNPKHATDYNQNAKTYNDQLSSLDQKFRSTIQKSPHKTLVFADRFPLLYFANDYDLHYYSAFPGCSDQTEADSSKVAYLIDKINSKSIPVIFKIELSDGKLADTISQETGAKVLEFHSAHNISANDFNDSVTYLDLMKRNLTTLEEALK